MAARVRSLLLTPGGRRAILVVYLIAAVGSIVTYTITRSPAYGLGQLALLGFAPLWIRWSLRRSSAR